jgi:hypothetical protein
VEISRWLRSSPPKAPEFLAHFRGGIFSSGARLAAAKARGIRLGRNGADRLAPVYRAEAAERARQLAPLLVELKGAGMSARQMASELTARRIATPNGARWHAQTILRMIDRAGC